MSEIRGLAIATGLVWSLSACGIEPNDGGKTPEELNHRIDVRDNNGFEEHAVNEWVLAHPKERLIGLTPLTEQGQFIGYLAVTEKDESGKAVDVFCERLSVPVKPNDVPALDKWHAENNAKPPNQRRQEVARASINNSASNVARGYIICSLPLRP